jgi:hypothetical protein
MRRGDGEGGWRVMEWVRWGEWRFRIDEEDSGLVVVDRGYCGK